MKQLVILFFIVVGFVNTSKAQLPSIDVKQVNGKATVYWVSQYNGIASITIQRSNNPKNNFLSIGSLEKQNRGPQKFTDEHPLPGNSYYRLQILFESEVEWYSDVKELITDSATMVNYINNIVEIDTAVHALESKPVFYFQPSTKVFADPVTGHINVALTDAVSKKYKLEFYDAKNKAILNLDRISKNNIVLDKHNLNRKGNIAFKLYESGKLLESGYVNVY